MRHYHEKKPVYNPSRLETKLNKTSPLLGDKPNPKGNPAESQWMSFFVLRVLLGLSRNMESNRFGAGIQIETNTGQTVSGRDMRDSWHHGTGTKLLLNRAKAARSSGNGLRSLD